MVTASRLRSGGAADAGLADPELPMLTVADLGILRDVTRRGGRHRRDHHADLLGLPGAARDRADLATGCAAAGFAPVEVRTRLAPAWTSDWITADGRRKLRAAGIAPPGPSTRPAGLGPAAPSR